MSWLLIFLSNYLIFFILLVIPWLWLHRQKILAVRASLAAGIAWLLAAFIKNIFYIPRPYIINHNSSSIGYWLDGSFPSGHTALCFALSFIIYSSDRRLGILFLIISASVSAARVFGGVHSLTDVGGGIFIGLCAAFLTLKIRKTAITSLFGG